MTKGYHINLPITTYPGDGSYYVMCDVCGRKFRRKDTVYITDKFNLQNRLVVCKADKDKAQPQLRPFKAREYKAPKIVRPKPGYVYVTNTGTNTLPSAPTLLVATGDPLITAIDVSWQGPDMSGSSAITGYNVYQAYPQLGVNILLATVSDCTFYQDTTSNISNFYTYQVAAVNSAGVGPLSNIAFWPYDNTDLSVTYLTMGGGALSMGGNAMTMGDLNRG